MTKNTTNSLLILQLNYLSMLLLIELALERSKHVRRNLTTLDIQGLRVTLFFYS